GSGEQGFSGDGGPATAATFNIGPADYGDIATDPAGNVYVADSRNMRVRKVDAQTGIITTFINTAPSTIVAVVTDKLVNVYVGRNGFSPTEPRILKLDPTGRILQSWGRGRGFSEDGTAAANAPLPSVQRLAIDLDGNILFSEDASGRIRRINLRNGLLETVAG